MALPALINTQRLGDSQREDHVVAGTCQSAVANMDDAATCLDKKAGHCWRKIFVQQQPHAVDRNGDSHSRTASAAASRSGSSVRLCGPTTQRKAPNIGHADQALVIADQFTRDRLTDGTDCLDVEVGGDMHCLVS